MKTARSKQAPGDYSWSRAGLEIKVCPISTEEFHLVLFRRVDGPQFFLYKGGRSDANSVARGIAVEISQAIDRELEASVKVVQELSPAGIRQRVSAFNDVVDALMGKPPRGFRKGRKRRHS